MRRQDLPNVFMPNGAIYIIDVNTFLQHEKLFTSKTIAYIMDSQSSIDVDTREDLHIVKKIIESS